MLVFNPKLNRLSLQQKRNFSRLTQSIKSQVMFITMNRPEVSNAFNEELIQEITKAFSDIDTNLCRAVVLTGNGKQFSAGADLNWMKKMVNYSKGENEKDSHYLFDMMNAIKKCPIPTIARVNGAALGGGAGIVASCDIAISVSSALFGFTEVKLGLIPAVISPFVLSKISNASASRYFLTGERFNATEARRIGLISNSNYFETEAEMDVEVNKILGEILASGSQATMKAKKLISSVEDLRFKSSEYELKNHVCHEIASIRVSQEGQEGLSAFLEKRKPNFVSKLNLE